LAKEKLRNIIFSEILIAIRFSVVGIVATAIHLLVALSLVTCCNTFPLLANLIAFLCAFLASFLGHFHWTFSSNNEQHVALIKFLAVALSAFAVNNLFLIVFLSETSLSREWSVAIAAMIIPLITFIASRLWVFKEK